MKIHRKLLSLLPSWLTPGKVLVIYGPRRVGKTTLLRDFLPSYQGKHVWINVDELKNQEALASRDLSRLSQLVGNNNLLIIDEAQRIENIGINLKIIVDSFPDVSILATGSASFDLANKIAEPLTGRTWTFCLYPVSYEELVVTLGSFETHTQLERWLIYGGYPEVVNLDNHHARVVLLDEIVGSYLYKDILELAGIKKSKKIIGLLRLLAFQIGNEVSIAELGNALDMSKNTISHYLDLLEKSFVIYYVSGFSRNLRKEIAKNGRYYFYDNGVRNALIGNFNRLEQRNDVGQLWENFMAIERRKYRHYSQNRANMYFWRTYEKHEVDLVEETGGRLYGYEFKWRGVVRKSSKQLFESTYSSEHAVVETITKDNFEKFVTKRTSPAKAGQRL